MNQPKTWTKEEMQHLFESRSKFPLKPYALIASELGRHAEACRDKWRRTNWEQLGFTSHEAEESRFNHKSKFVNQQIDALDKRHNIFQLRADAIGDAFEKAIEALPNVPKPVYKPNKRQSIVSSEDVGLLLSDLHIGHQHTLEETGGISEYSIDTFFKRLDNLKQAMVEIVDLHKNLYKLPKLHIFCAGDIVAGMNAAGAWSPVYIVSPIVDQMILGFDALSGIIQYWLGLFEEIHFYGIGGNHGRSAPMGIQKDHDNWDYVCYKFLEVAFKNNPRVKFNIPKTWWLKERIRNHNFLLVHGDYTNGAGLPLKALSTFEQKMGQIVNEKIDYTLAGHYHNSAELTTNSGKIILNGSFIGSDVYSLRNVHAASKPEQKLFGIHDFHGITWTYNINLDSPRERI